MWYNTLVNERRYYMTYLEEHYDEIFKKYTDEQLLKDIESYRNGGGV